MPKPEDKKPKHPKSNAPEGYADVNENGYPLFYAIGGDGKPVGKPRLVWDNANFEDEAEIRNYNKRMERRKEYVWVNDSVGKGDIPALSMLNPEMSDTLKWMYAERLPYSTKTGRALFFDMLDGNADQVNSAINHGSIVNPGSVPHPCPDTALQAKLDRLYAKYEDPNWMFHKGQEVKEGWKKPKVGE